MTSSRFQYELRIHLLAAATRCLVRLLADIMSMLCIANATIMQEKQPSVERSAEYLPVLG